MKTYIEELLTIFSGFYQTVFSFSTAHSLQQLFPQLTAHSNFFHSHSPTKQTLNEKDRLLEKQEDILYEEHDKFVSVQKSLALESKINEMLSSELSACH
jgi:hypothetical protein